MASDTGAPWNLPYPEDTDLVKDGAADIEALAEAVADGLDAAGGLVAVKSALFTGTQTASVTAGNDVAVTNLSITHAMSDANNKLIISAYIGSGANSAGFGFVGLAVMDGTTLIGTGPADGSRTRVGASHAQASGFASLATTIPSMTFVYEPPDTTSRTYTVRAINVESSTRTLFINRSDSNPNNAQSVRSSSGLVIQEVKV
jgi:hypothetical protein